MEKGRLREALLAFGSVMEEMAFPVCATHALLWTLECVSIC